MNRHFLGATLLVGGLCALLPNLGLAQAPPIQDDPQARDHVLRLPPSYNPATGALSNGNQTSRYDGARYGAPQYGAYGGQPQQPQTYQASPAQASPAQSGPAPRYGGSLLGAPNIQTPGYGAPPPGDASAYAPAAQPNPYVRPDNRPQPYGSQDPSIIQEPLAPPPGTAPAGPAQVQQKPSNIQATPPDASQPLAPQSTSPAQLATPQASPDSPGNTGTPPFAGTEAQKTPAPDLPNVWLPAGMAKLQALDKVNAQASALAVKVGQSTTFGSLTITVKSCVIRPPDQPADAAAFVDVTDSHPDSTGFSGWLLENEPSVSIMQHPIYDLRVTGCA
jgi:hypothetical protein